MRGYGLLRGAVVTAEGGTQERIVGYSRRFLNVAVATTGCSAHSTSVTGDDVKSSQMSRQWKQHGDFDMQLELLYRDMRSRDTKGIAGCNLLVAQRARSHGLLLQRCLHAAKSAVLAVHLATEATVVSSHEEREWLFATRA